MTFEHKIVVGLEEISAVIFECGKCKSRTVIAPDALESIPHECPNNHAWNWNLPIDHGGSPFVEFVNSLKKLRDPMGLLHKNSGFRILLEFEGPRKTDGF